MSKPGWANPLPSSNKKQKATKGGYTKPDRAVRCTNCSVGSDQGGNGIGTPISSYVLSAGLPEGGSVAVARVPICYRCGTIQPFELLAGACEHGITAANITRLLKARTGLLADLWYTLAELQAGEVRQAAALPDIVAQPIGMEAGEGDGLLPF